MTKHSRIFIIACCLFGAPAIADDKKKPVPVKVTVTPVVSQHIPDQDTEAGKLKSNLQTNLSFSVSGKLVKKNFQDGQAVKKGQVIASLDDSEPKAALAQAVANLDIAKDKYSRALKLVKAGSMAISKEDFHTLKSQLQLQQADVEQARATLDKYHLTAPFSGQLTNYAFAVGSYIGAGTTLVVLTNIDKLWAYYSMDQKYKAAVKLGQRVAITASAFPKKTFAGKVDFVSPVVDPTSGRFDVHAEIPNRHHELSPGMFVNITQQLGKGNNVLVVPQSALQVNGNAYHVFVVNDNTAEQRSVTPGDNLNSNLVVIKSGLSEGEQVVVAGMQKLQDKTPVVTESEVESGASSKPATPAASKSAAKKTGS